MKIYKLKYSITSTSDSRLKKIRESGAFIIKNEKQGQKQVLEYFILNSQQPFSKVKLAMGNQVEDEIPLLINDTNIEAHLSFYNKGLRKWLFIARIDSTTTSKGHGTKFIDKLKIFAKQNGFIGICAYPEAKRSFDFFVKNGFKKQKSKTTNYDGSLLFFKL